MLRLLGTLSDVRVRDSYLQGIPIVEVTLGDVMEPWEIEEKWAEVERAMALEREAGVEFVEEKRDAAGRFRSYRVEALNIKKGRL